MILNPLDYTQKYISPWTTIHQQKLSGLQLSKPEEVKPKRLRNAEGNLEERAELDGLEFGKVEEIVESEPVRRYKTLDEKLHHYSLKRANDAYRHHQKKDYSDSTARSIHILG